jgi:RNA polymerase sigma factor (sigma-70 family)
MPQPSVDRCVRMKRDASVRPGDAGAVLVAPVCDPEGVSDTAALPEAEAWVAPTWEQVYADTHLDPQIQAALDALSPEFRVAVVLCDIEGLTYEEIAATLGIKLGTVRSRIHRGRVQLREALAHLAPRAPVMP